MKFVLIAVGLAIFLLVGPSIAVLGFARSSGDKIAEVTEMPAVLSFDADDPRELRVFITRERFFPARGALSFIECEGEGVASKPVHTGVNRRSIIQPRLQLTLEPGARSVKCVTASPPEGYGTDPLPYDPAVDRVYVRPARHSVIPYAFGAAAVSFVGVCLVAFAARR